jgi:hypothetical protein
MKLPRKLLYTLRWMPAYFLQRIARRTTYREPIHFIFCLADHFEPSIVPGNGRARADKYEQERRLEQWCEEIPKAVDKWRDADGAPLRHTYFYPAEQYDRDLIERLADHCKKGWGEIEIHLHHGVDEADTAENTKRQLLEFRDKLAGHGCLSRWEGAGEPRYGFVHGNFALANSYGGRYCGVNSELQVLADTGCYADFTLPSAPAPSQIAKINALYECTLPLYEKVPHRRGKDLQVGRPAKTFPLMVQGPLGIDFFRRKWNVPIPRIENGELASMHPPLLKRLSLWELAGIRVEGRPSWLFIKLHCHGMDPRDSEVMFGRPMQNFLRDLVHGASGGRSSQVHFMTAREMVNVILAACDGREGKPGDYRNYRLRPLKTSDSVLAPAVLSED